MSQGLHVLAISEDSDVRNLIQMSLEAEGYQAMCVSQPQEALELFKRGVVSDFLLFDAARNKCRDSLFSPALLQSISSDAVCILSEMGDTSWKAHAQRWKINKILTKPLLRRDLENLVANPVPSQIAPKSFSAPTTAATPAFHLEELENGSFFFAISPAMMQMYKNIRILAPVDHPVLILGESGVGKEVVARLLHKHHARADKKFLNVNCAALPSELLESELFGYETGAFTGAVKAKPGKFELANKGTLLLDEIGEMSPQMQAKLLHVLQDGTFSRLGARSTTQVDVRILAATNVNMEEAIAQKRFREDLYYRLNAFTITVPSLRERREELPFLIEQLVKRGAAELGQEPFAFSGRIMEAVQEYHWPGNLRELRNFVTRTLVLQDQEAAYNDLRSKTKTNLTASTNHSAAGSSSDDQRTDASNMRNIVKGLKHQTEIRMIREALSASGWNRRRAATDLNISYRTLLYKIQQHGLTN